jgi:glycosyltransferase involved in cell wall biosynthesis
MTVMQPASAQNEVFVPDPFMGSPRRVLVNAVTAKMGGAANYVDALARTLGGAGTPHTWTFIGPPSIVPVMRRFFAAADVIVTDAGTGGVMERLKFDQWTLRNLVNRVAPDALFSTGNIALLKCPCPQILLVRNALFFSRLYRRHVGRNKGWGLRAAERARRVAIVRSIRTADLVLTPSRTMRDEIVADVPEAAHKIIVNYYGVDPTPAAAREREAGSWRLLFPSLYAEHKNLGTLLTALALLDSRGIACVLETPADPRPQATRTVQARREASQAEMLVPRGLVRFTGTLSRADMSLRYGAADIAVYPSVVESFGHTLVESMAAGLPVIAADVEINREICGDAALFFGPFDAAQCASQIERVLSDSGLRVRLAARSRERAAAFSWRTHVDVLERLIAGTLVEA